MGALLWSALVLSNPLVLIGFYGGAPACEASLLLRSNLEPEICETIHEISII